MTSRYIHNCVSRTPEQMDSELPVVTDVFNAAGYDTAYFGKWHLNGSNKITYVPRENRGRFNSWIGYENNNAQYECWVHGHNTEGRDDTDPFAEKLSMYETDALTDKLLDYLKGRSPNYGDGKPFFAVLSVQPPHNPHVAPSEFADRFKPEDIILRPNVPDIPRIVERAREDLAGYYAQIENLDFNVGRIIKMLRDMNLERSTHVLFFSDHGDMHGSHGYVRKSSPWEEAVCIPFIVRPAGGLPGGAESNACLNHVDIAPTSVALCGLRVPDWMAGTDLSPAIYGNKDKPYPSSAYLQHSFRKRFDCLNRPWRGVRTADGWKYVCLEGQPIFLFNLNEDPYETANLAFLDTFNDKREELQSELQAWMMRTGDEFRLPEL